VSFAALSSTFKGDNDLKLEALMKGAAEHNKRKARKDRSLDNNGNDSGNGKQ